MAENMLTVFQIRKYNGAEIRLSNDGFFNLTDMAIAAGKNRKYANDWLSSEQGREYLEIAHSKSGNADLLRVVHGGGDGRGTWAHYKIARRFAQACCAEFAWWVDETIEHLATNRPVETPEFHLMKWAEGMGLAVQGHDLRIAACEETEDRHEQDIIGLYAKEDARLTRKVNRQEADIRDELAKTFGGNTEVDVVRCGKRIARIDVYVKGQLIIEVKAEDNWQTAIGQLKTQAFHDKDARKMAVFFCRDGRTPYRESRRRQIAVDVNNDGIKVFWWDNQKNKISDVDYNTSSQAKQRKLFE